MPAANVSVSALYFTPAPIPQPVTTHPRMWVTKGDIATLRTWAVPTNDVYQKGLRDMLTNAIKAYKLCFPNSQPGNPGTRPRRIRQGRQRLLRRVNVSTSPVNVVTDEHIFILAFFALIDPDSAARVTYAGYARDMIMYEMGRPCSATRRASLSATRCFALFNRSNNMGEALPLAVDWLQGVTDANDQPVTILSPQDKAIIRKVFMMWADDCLHAPAPTLPAIPIPSA